MFNNTSEADSVTAKDNSKSVAVQMVDGDIVLPSDLAGKTVIIIDEVQVADEIKSQVAAGLEASHQGVTPSEKAELYASLAPRNTEKTWRSKSSFFKTTDSGRSLGWRINDKVKALGGLRVQLNVFQDIAEPKAKGVASKLPDDRLKAISKLLG